MRAVGPCPTTSHRPPRSGPRNVRASPRNGGCEREAPSSVFAGQPAFRQVSPTWKQSPAYASTRHRNPLTCANAQVRPAETSSQWGTRSALPPLRGLPFQSLGSGRVAEIEACRADTLPFSSLPLSYARPLRTSHYRSVSGPRRVGSDLHSKRRLALPLGVVPVDRECRPRGQRTATGWGTALERPMSPGVGTAR